MKNLFSHESYSNQKTPIVITVAPHPNGTYYSFRYNGRQHDEIKLGDPIPDFGEWLKEYGKKVPCCAFCDKLLLPGVPTTTARMWDDIERRGHSQDCLGPYAGGHTGHYEMDGTFVSDEYGPSHADPVTGAFIRPIEQLESQSVED